MELQIQDLIAQIKKDGMEEAEKTASSIIEAAKQQAKKITDAAQAEADKTLEACRKQCALEEEGAKAAIRQASRDVVLSLKAELSRLLSESLAHSVQGALASKDLAALIQAAIQGRDPKDLAVEVKAVDGALKANLAKELNNGLELRLRSDVAGFKVLEKDGSGYYDFTDEAIAEMLRPYLGSLNI